MFQTAPEEGSMLVCAQVLMSSGALCLVPCGMPQPCVCVTAPCHTHAPVLALCWRRLEDMAVDVIGRLYSASAAGQDALTSTSAGLYSDDSVRTNSAPQKPCTMTLL